MLHVCDISCANSLMMYAHYLNDDGGGCGIINDSQLVFANPGTAVAQKLREAGLVEQVGAEWFFLTAGDAVQACYSRLRENAL